MAFGPDWLWTTIGAVLAAFAAVLTATALFADRPRGRRRCPRCWYDLAGLPATQCPECGHDAGTQRRLARTRRHWRFISVAGATLALGWLTASWPTIRRDGWLRAVPSTVLVLCPFNQQSLLSEFVQSQPIGSTLGDELLSRVQRLELRSWQYRLLAWRIKLATSDAIREGSVPDDLWLPRQPGTQCEMYSLDDLAPIKSGTRVLRSCFPGCRDVVPYTSNDHAESLRSIIIDTIDPESWFDNGGDSGRIVLLGPNLIVCAQPAAHRQINDLLISLRAAVAARTDPSAPLPANVQKLPPEFAPSQPRPSGRGSPAAILHRSTTRATDLSALGQVSACCRAARPPGRNLTPSRIPVRCFEKIPHRPLASPRIFC